MKSLIITLFLALSSFTFAEESTINLKKGGSVKFGKITITASIKGQNVSIQYADGKQKFGANSIGFKKGDLYYTRSRLSMTVPLQFIQEARYNKPVLITEFTAMSPTS